MVTVSHFLNEVYVGVFIMILFIKKLKNLI
nr:MAG TPA: hypothetical protein [Caudoviricetes sp.]